MSMQISSLPVGANASLANPQDLHGRRPLPHAERKPNFEAAETLTRSNAEHPPPDLNQTTQALEQISLAFNQRLKFEIDQESREILVKVIDNETDKVIKVLPPEELQRMHSRIRETIGFLFDRMV